jgi:hypothetical protein
MVLKNCIYEICNFGGWVHVDMGNILIIFEICHMEKFNFYEDSMKPLNKNIAGFKLYYKCC